MKLALPARCHHNPNSSLSTFHIRKVKSCMWNVRDNKTTMAENFLELSCTTEDFASIVDGFSS